MHKSAIFTFGRFNPITVGHSKLFSAIKSHSAYEQKPYFIFVSPNEKGLENPLTFKEKIYYLKNIEEYTNFVFNENIKSPLDAIHWLIENDYTDLTMIVGSDRVEHFNNVINSYIDKFNICIKFKVMNGGTRKEDSRNIFEFASSSKARFYAYTNDFTSFNDIFPGNTKQTKDMFKLLQTRIGEKKNVITTSKQRRIKQSASIG